MGVLFAPLELIFYNFSLIIILLCYNEYQGFEGVLYSKKRPPRIVDVFFAQQYDDAQTYCQTYSIRLKNIKAKFTKIGTTQYLNNCRHIFHIFTEKNCIYASLNITYITLFFISSFSTIKIYLPSVFFRHLKNKR